MTVDEKAAVCDRIPEVSAQLTPYVTLPATDPGVSPLMIKESPQVIPLTILFTFPMQN